LRIEFKKWEHEARDYLFLVIIGISIGFFVALFELGLDTLLSIFRYIISIDNLLAFIILPFTMLVAYFTVMLFGKIKRTGSGTHQILDAYYIHNGFIHPKDTISKTIASLITLGLGGCAGPEGPSMLIGSGISSYLSRKFKISPSKWRKFSMAGASAGVAAIFRAPLTGMLFALEIPFKRDIETEAFIEAIVASISAYLVFVLIIGPERIFRTELGMFKITYIGLIHSLIIGIFASIIAMIFIFSYRSFEFFSLKIVHAIHPREYILPIIGGLFLAIMVFIQPDVAGPGYEVIKKVITVKSIRYLFAIAVVLLIFKMFATGVTLSFGGSGGTFIPSLAVGALTGYLYSILIHSPNQYLYTVVGMASVLAATNKTPLTAVALVAETIGPGTVIPTIIASTTSYLLTGYYSFFKIQYPRRIEKEEMVLSEIYHKILETYPEILDRIKAFQVMTPKPVYLTSDMTVRKAFEIVSHFQFRIYPILYKDRLVGEVSLEDLLGIPEDNLDTRITTFVRDPVCVSSSSTLREVIEKMLSSETDHVIVIDKEWHLLGIIADVDIIRILLDRFSTLHRK